MRSEWYFSICSVLWHQEEDWAMQDPRGCVLVLLVTRSR